MCVLSAVIDHHTRTWPSQFPNAWPPVSEPVTIPYRPPNGANNTFEPGTQKQLDTLRKEVAELSAQVEYLLKIIPTLRKYDEDNNEPDCEMQDKVELVRRLCEALGIDNDVL